MACDICGKVGTSLTPLHGIYQTDDIKDICPDCEKIVNAQLSKIQESHRQAQRRKEGNGTTGDSGNWMRGDLAGE